MSSPCTGDQTTCGKQFNRAVACYQVPPGFQFTQGWTTATGVKLVSSSLCPDVASTLAYDANSGAQVPRDADGKLVVTTVCPACNYVAGVQPWIMNTCPCFAAGDFCNITSGTNGVCQKNNNMPCTSAECPTGSTTATQTRTYPYPHRMCKARQR